MKPKRKSVTRHVLVLLIALTAYTTSSRGESSPVTSISPIHTLKATGGNYSVAFSPDGEMLAAGNYDGTIQLFSVSDGSLLRTMRAPLPNDPYKKNANTIVFSGDGRVLASGHDDGNVRLWQVSTGTLLQPPLKGNSGRVLSVSFSPNGQTLAMGSDALTAGSHGITLWRLSDGSILRTFDVGHGYVAFGPDGQTLAVNDGSSIKLLQVSDGRQLRTLGSNYNHSIEGSPAFSPDGETLAVGSLNVGNHTVVFRVSDGRLLYERETQIKNFYHAGSTTAVVFSPDGKVFYTAATGLLEESRDSLSTIRIWQATDGRLLHTYKLSGYGVISFSISPDGQTLAAGFVDKATILLWRSNSENIAFDKMPQGGATTIKTKLLTPPIPYEDSGACPFECCTYRRWIATKDTAIRRDRNENSPTLFNVNKGEWVSALTGIVVTTVPGKARILRPTTINGITAKNGEIVYLLTNQGEGVYETWYKGKKWEPYPDMSALEIMQRPESTWWVQIKNNKGQVGWSKEPDNFGNRDRCGGSVDEVKQPDKNLAGTGNIALSLCEVASYADLARQAYEVAGFGKGLWISVPPWKLVDSFVDSKLSHGLVGDRNVDIRSGLKAGLFRNSKTNDLAIFFAGTEGRDFRDFEAKLAEVLNFTTMLPPCAVHLPTCDFLGSAYLQFKNGRPINEWSSTLSGVDPNVILSEPAWTNSFYALIGLMWSGNTDVNSDINIAYPKLDPTPKKGARVMFELARNQYDIWNNQATMTDRFGSAGSGRIIMVGGHSLGGSIAQVVGLSKNIATITFNSAPVPLDPEYRNEISYDPNRNNMLNVRSSDDLMTGFMFSLQSNDRLRSLLTTLIEGIYQQRGNVLDENLKSRFEAVINDNNFYAGKGNWLVNDAQTGHEIQPLAENLKNKNNCAANTSGTVPLGINPTVAKDNNVKQVAPKTVSKAKKVTRAGCNKSSSVLSPSNGGAQGALKKYGNGTDGCAQ